MRRVPDRSRETQKVMNTPSRMTARRMTADTAAFPGAAPTPTKNMVMTLMRKGNHPLQGTKLLVRMAMSRSRGESMILHPTTPAALHPNPMHIVSACLPQAFAF